MERMEVPAWEALIPGSLRAQKKAPAIPDKCFHYRLHFLISKTGSYITQIFTD